MRTFTTADDCYDNNPITKKKKGSGEVNRSDLNALFFNVNVQSKKTFGKILHMHLFNFTEGEKFLRKCVCVSLI